MSKRSSQRKTQSAQEIVPSSKKFDAINELLQKMLERFPAKGQITASEIQDWQRDLAPFSLEAIDFAFETHRRNAIFFPINAQILDLCISYSPAEQVVVSSARCDAQCRSRHGKGYHETDIRKLQEIYQKRLDLGTISHHMKDSEYESLLDELDVQRGSSPEWRQTL